MMFLVAHLSLIPFPTDDAVEYDGSVSTIGPILRGTLQSTPHVFRDTAGKERIYFTFPDVSVKLRGCFKMKVSLFRLPG